MKVAETLEVAVPGATFEIKYVRRPKNAARPEPVRWERRVTTRYADQSDEARRRRGATRAREARAPIAPDDAG